MFSLFWPKKVLVIPKIDLFSHFYVNHLFGADTTMCRNSNFVLFFSPMKKPFSKVQKSHTLFNFSCTWYKSLLGKLPRIGHWLIAKKAKLLVNVSCHKQYELCAKRRCYDLEICSLWTLNYLKVDPFFPKGGC